MSNFDFLKEEYPQIARTAMLAEELLYFDPPSALVKMRFVCEKAIEHIGDFCGLSHEVAQKNLVDRIRLLYDHGEVPREMNDILHRIRKSGNNAAHKGTGSHEEARYMLRQLFYFVSWFYATYEDSEVQFDFVVPTAKPTEQEAIKAKEQEIERLKETVKNYEQKIKSHSEASKEQREERQKRSNKLVGKINETEAETRERIDQQLRDAGWECDTQTLNHKTRGALPMPKRNMAIAEWPCGGRWADYALFVGEELVGIVEAKKHAKDVMNALEQAKNYSRNVDALPPTTIPQHANSANYKVPFVFATNGRKYLEQLKSASGIWFWDATDQRTPAKALPEWFTPRDLKEKLNFDKTIGESKLSSASKSILTNPDGLNLRYYQVEAIEAVEQKILHQPQEERALIAMATGTGKTRTILGLCYRLIAAKRFRRILFLVDRQLLGTQAADAFKEVKIENLQTFAQIYDIQELTNKLPELDTKIQFATVQSMVRRIEDLENAPSVGDFDCIIVDEAHRGYTLDRDMDNEEMILHDQKDFQSKYRMVLDYFDAYRIGLTATPAVHTSEIFGKPVYTYSYRKAVVDGFLVDFEPPYVFQTQLSENGIVWKKGDPVKVYDPEDNTIEDAGEAEDEIKLEIASFNRRVINRNFNKAVLGELVENYDLNTESQAKTLIFAATTQHADMIVELLFEILEENGAATNADGIVKIVGDTDDRKKLLRRYKNDQLPNIVVTVDLLTTGVDIPPISKLVFLRRVNSRILYDQMLGRATRLCPEIGKEVFHIYDCVGVTEIMAKHKVMKPVAPSPKKTFIDLVEEIQQAEDEKIELLKLDRIIAKLQRKARKLSEKDQQQFQRLSGEESVNDFSQKLKSLSGEELKNELQQRTEFWNYFDNRKAPTYFGGILYSEHADQVTDVQRAYSKKLKPKDYIESFVEYINANINQVEALKIIATRPAELDRQSLKEIKLILDTQGFTPNGLNTAYQESENVQVTADIITHIRKAAMGTELIDHNERISRAVDKVRQAHTWNSIQKGWLDKIEKQLLKESVLQVEDLDKAPFSIDGGKKRMDKAFKRPVEEVLGEINGYLYA